MFKKQASYRLLSLFSILCMLLLVTVLAPVVHAQNTITVDSAADIVSSDGNCTLREAINNVNAGSDTTSGDCVAGTGLGDTINFAPSLNGSAITIALPNGGLVENLNVNGDFDIRSDVTIEGNGTAVTILDGGNLDRIFNVLNGATATFRDLTVRNGNADTNPGGGRDGGGIQVRQANSTAIIENCIIRNNVGSPSGGGLDVRNGTVGNAASATVSNSIFFDNTARNGGALSAADRPNVTVNNTLFESNQTSSGRGGAIFVNGAGDPAILNINNSTFSGNNSPVDGGAIHARDSDADPNVIIIIRNSTFANNSSNLGSVFNIQTGDGISVDVQNTIITNNTGSSTCTEQTFTTSTNNLIDDTSCDGASTPVTNFDTTLRDSGGPTQTHALLPGSNGIDTGVNSCPDHTGAELAADQRGEARPVDYDRDNTATCDIGAFERQADETFTDTVGDNDTITFGATMSTIADTGSGTAPGQVTVIRYNQAPGGMPASAAEMPFQVSIAAATATGLNVDLTLCYTDWEVAQGSAVEANLLLWRWNTGTSFWDNIGADTVDTVNNCVTKNNVSALSSWTLASGSPTAITLYGASVNNLSTLWIYVSVLLLLLITFTGMVLFLRRRP